MFTSNGGYCIYYPLDIFRNTKDFRNNTRILPGFSWAIFSQVKDLDQSRAGEIYK